MTTIPRFKARADWTAVDIIEHRRTDKQPETDAYKAHKAAAAANDQRNPTMSTTTDITPEQQHAAYRDAIAMIRAAANEDTEAVGVLWNNSTSKPALIYALPRVAGVLAAAAAAGAGATVDLDDVLKRVLHDIPANLSDLTGTDQEDS